MKSFYIPLLTTTTGSHTLTVTGSTSMTCIANVWSRDGMTLISGTNGTLSGGTLTLTVNTTATSQKMNLRCKIPPNAKLYSVDYNS